MNILRTGSLEANFTDYYKNRVHCLVGAISFQTLKCIGKRPRYFRVSKV